MGDQTEEDLELEKQLEILNKPAIRSFQNKYGDTYDCVDVNKQPSLDHPLLKNHKIQLKPDYNVQRIFKQARSSRKNLLETRLKINCSIGTVPIRRTTKQDLVRAKRLYESYNNAKIQGYSTLDGGSYHFAGIQTKKDPNKIYRGVSAYVSLAKPELYNDKQSSAAYMAVGNGNDAILLGWMINPGVYSDKQTRLFTHWDGGGNTGCYNIFCRGFVQTDPKIALDHVFDLSHAVAEVLTIAQNREGQWWLVWGKEGIGYWPKELFPRLGNGADYLFLGGRVYDAGNKEWPDMGTGKYVEGDYTQTASMYQVLFSDNNFKTTQPNDAMFELLVDHCYDAGDNSFKADNQTLNYSFLYGGGGLGEQCD